MAKVTANGITVHYQQKGSGSDVILVHGITSSLALWIPKVFPLLAEEFRVTAIDLRGHGLTELTPHGYTSRELAEDLRSLMDAVEIERAQFVGHSFGGSVALHLALLHPERVRGVVLLDSGLACLRHMRTIKKWPGWRLFRRGLRKYGLSYERFRELDQQQDISEVLRRSFRVPVQFGFRKGKTRETPRLRRLVDETSLGRAFRDVAGLTMDRLPEIQARVLAMYGVTSPYRQMGEYLAQTLPNCSFATVPEAGHFYLLQEPDLILSDVSEFLHAPDAGPASQHDDHPQAGGEVA